MPPRSGENHAVKIKVCSYLLLAGLFGGAVCNVPAQGTAFLYQGRLNDNGSPANATYDLRFAIYDAATNGNAVSFSQTNFAAVVSGGLLTATLDFGPIFSGANYWLAIGVRTNGSTNAFTLLWPRQPLLPVPYAMFAASTSNLLGALPATQLAGTLPSAQLAGTYSSAVNITNAANTFFGKFFGNGIGLTNLSASMLATGTVADARLSTNVALLNQSQTNGGANLFTGGNTFTGPNTFANGGNSFLGAFAGNGNLLTNLNATQLIVGTVADLRLSTNVALLNQSQIYGGANVFTGSNYFSAANGFAGPNNFTGTNLFAGVNAFTNGGNTFFGAHAGNGIGLTNLSATMLATGTVADVRLSTNVALLNQSQTNGGANFFTGANNFTNIANSFSGNFFGNGLVGWIPYAGTSTQAVRDTGYLLTGSQLTIITMPSVIFAGDIVRISGAGSGGWRAVGSGSQTFIGNFSSYRSSLWVPASVLTGNNWTSIASSADGSRMYAVANSALGGGFYTSTDAGHTWTGPNTFFSGSWTAVATSADGIKVYLVTSGKAIEVSSDGGVSWGPVNSLVASNCLSIACSADGTKVIAAVKNGSVYVSSNSGGSWAGTGLAAGTWVVAYAGNGSNYAAANSVGNTFSLVGGSPAYSANFTALVCSADGSKLAASSSSGLVYVSANSGASYAASAAPVAAWNCLAASSDCSRLVAGVNNGPIYASANFGANWSLLAGSSSQVWSALGASADGTKMAGGVNTASGGLYFFSADGQSLNTSTNSFITGSQGSAVELQFIGNNQFMPVSSAGSIWVN